MTGELGSTRTAITCPTVETAYRYLDYWRWRTRL
jgi:hypothetical protein